jgi:hypothetical protein
LVFIPILLCACNFLLLDPSVFFEFVLIGLGFFLRSGVGLGTGKAHQGGASFCRSHFPDQLRSVVPFLAHSFPSASFMQHGPWRRLRSHPEVGNDCESYSREHKLHPATCLCCSLHCRTGSPCCAQLGFSLHWFSLFGVAPFSSATAKHSRSH